ncbi:MAG: Tfp pilus assembly protein PilF [Planctomycetota bacterium]|jgi:Tfp pilus assembly protein PilF
MQFSKIWVLAPLLACCIAWASLALGRLQADNTALPQEPTFVGRQSCEECHATESKLWRGSHHDRAMDHATESSVLGDFNDAKFERLGVTSRFYRKDGRFFVHTEGVGGAMQEFEIAYTFGFAPLQQYLIAFPDGRLQCLPIAWDTVQKRWYHLQNEQPVAPDDWLHWTRPAQNWNGMCASCHSTNLNKGLDSKTLNYQTEWFEIDVSCEACHGPASEHLNWARQPQAERSSTGDLGLLLRPTQLEPRAKVELCARCHSRRVELKDFDHAGGDMLDSFLPDLLNEGEYFPDGQILDEVYVYGSFVQSRMYHEGVHCGNCHEAHSGQLVAEGNALCMQCHKAPYDSVEHHHHRVKGELGEALLGSTGEVPLEVGTGALCVSCHMPGRTYMGTDYRPDHSMRVPRPDLSVALGTPNACTSCHSDQEPAWAAAKVVEWFGIKRPEHFARTIAAGRRGDPGGDERLALLIGQAHQPVIVRATALTLLANYANELAWKTIRPALQDGEALIRHAAVRSYREVHLQNRLQHLLPLLQDAVRAVRSEAAQNLSEIPAQLFPPEHREAFQSALAEYEGRMEFNADAPSSQLALGNLYQNLGRSEDARQRFAQALVIDNRFLPARANLAVLLNMLGRNAEAEACLREGLVLHPQSHDLTYSLSLLLAEKNEMTEAVALMTSAAAGLPNTPRIHYNLGLLLQQHGQLDRAQAALQRALQLDPRNWDTLFALADHHLKRGDLPGARSYSTRMLELRPNDPLAQELMRRTGQ